MKIVKKRVMKKIIVPKDCYFCKEKKEPKFSDVEVLQRYITERAKIVGKDRSGICSKHQGKLTLAIKYARHLALLPFIGNR